ncbi:MAG TPA: TIGR03936 family radical SAM-associated protein [Jatrophihabitantaceae bacterium]|nr:TIGR03936 family radical SAM-associated protein [Jatrophihabitantaceae bacterium]
MQYAKRGRLRFASQRDFARAFERALRRAEVPMAYSAGFSPHPKISYVGAAPTGAASEAEYVEIGLTRTVDLAELRAALDAALPDGLDIVAAVEAGPHSLAERVQASHWRIELPGVDPDVARSAVAALLDRAELHVERVTKTGRKDVDVRAALVRCGVPERADGPQRPGRAILDLVVRQVTPAVRPDDVLAALRIVAGLALDAPPIAVRLAQGPLDDAGAVGDALSADRDSLEGAP